MPNIDPKLLDRIAELEANALLDGLQDDEQRSNPQFLAAVRRFLKENKLITQGDLPAARALKREMTDIPELFEQ